MIEISNLVKKFGAATALDGITCSIGGGSVFGLVGSNGAGKSTLSPLKKIRKPFRPPYHQLFWASSYQTLLQSQQIKYNSVIF